MMEPNAIIELSLNALESGGTLLYPTDTIWGLGCDVTNGAAVEKIYALKRRDHSKSMLVLCSDMEMVDRYIGGVGEEVRSLLVASGRPTTVIMPLQRRLLADNLIASDGTIGVRIPRMDFCQRLLRSFGRPIVSTSANLSGSPSPSCFSDIDRTLVDAVDCCVPPSMEESTECRSSRIVKVLPDGSLRIIRE